MSRYFITAAGTGVGKTFLTCAMLHAARRVGVALQAYKPVISGFDSLSPEMSDTGLILRALGQDPQDSRNIDRISPWRYAAPLSPHMSAALENRPLDVEQLFRWTRVNTANPCLIEAVGGVMVPLDTHHTVRDWIEALQLPVILVTGSYLGSISHGLTALEALRARHIPVAALVVNESEDSEVSFEKTVATYHDFARDVPRIIAQRHGVKVEDATAAQELMRGLEWNA